MQSTSREEIIDFILHNDLSLLPLRGVVDGKCTCGNFNCTSPGKHPLFSYSWQKIATRNKEKIQNWLNKYQNINFAILTGCYSKKFNKHLIVVDVDEPEHEILQKLPKTLCYKTGSGGYHFWYWSKELIKSRVSVFEKVDIRGAGGYAIIPPSKHVNGEYIFIFSGIKEAIAEVPEFILKASSKNTSKNKTGKKKAKKKIKNSSGLQTNIWSESSVGQIREMLTRGELIPDGVRNSTIHRLLSSDRAKGAEEKDLKENAKFYRKKCMKFKEITHKELQHIIDNVKKYPAYNNCHEKVNERYFMWLQEKGKYFDEDIVKIFIREDKKFFDSLRKEEDKNKFCPLKKVTIRRELFLRSRGFEGVSVYRPQLLAKKLKELGFERKRTAKGNLWNIKL